MFRFRPDKVTLHIHAVEDVVYPAQHIVITDAVIAVSRGLDTKPVQSRESLVADKDSDIIALFQVHQMTAGFFPFLSDHTGFPIRLIFFKVMAQKPFPVCLHRVMDGMPVPVHNAVGAGSQMAVCLQAQLSPVRRPAGPSLGLCLYDQIIIIF